MEAKRTDAILISGVLTVGTGLILQIISEATTFWMYYNHYSNMGVHQDVHYGLFKGCFSDTCEAYTEPTEQLRTVQALTLTGLVLAALVGILFIVVIILGYKHRLKTSGLGACAGILAMVSGLLTFTGAIYFAVQLFSADYLTIDKFLWMNLGYSFALSIVGAGVTGTGGILAWIGTGRVVAAQNRTLGQIIAGGLPVGNAPGGVNVHLSQTSQHIGMQPYATVMYPPNSGPAMSPPPAGYPPQQYGFAGYAPSPPPYEGRGGPQNGY